MALDAPLTLEHHEGKLTGTRVVVLNGPLTLRNIFELQTFLRTPPEPTLSILDLTSVPYMDSAGMGLIVNHFVHLQTRGAKMFVVGVSPRVLELFKITRVDSVIPQAVTAEAAEANA